MGYTPEQKQQVITMWPELGTAETERLTGVPARTILRYVNEAGLMSHDRQEKTAEMRAAMSEKVVAAWGDFRQQEALAAGSTAARMRRAAIEASDERDSNLLRARVIAYGIFIDKAELLSGQATQRIALWAESEIDRDLRKAIEEMEEKIRGEG